jgi:hypothetical protein
MAADAAERAAYVALVAEQGYPAARAAFPTVNVNTGRGWVMKARASAPAETMPPPTGRTHADDLQREAEAAGETERAILRRVEQATEEGDANAARAFSAAARDQSARRRDREGEARAARQHEVHMRREHSQLSAAGVRAYELIVRLYIEALGFGWGRAQAEFADALLHAFTQGERLPNGNWHVRIPEHELAAVRAAINRQLRAEPEAEKPAGADEIDLGAIEADVGAEGHPQELASPTEPPRASDAQIARDVLPPDQPSPTPLAPTEDERPGLPVEGFLRPITPRRPRRQGAGISFRWQDQ